jgi:hypothetical protein
MIWPPQMTCRDLVFMAGDYNDMAAGSQSTTKSRPALLMPFRLVKRKLCQDSVAVGLSQFPLRLQPKLQIAAGWSAVDLPQLPGAGSDPFFGSSRG